LYQTLLRKGLGIYPRLPWIPFNAIRHFDGLIRPSWVILEIGAGMSTLWYAARCRRVVSVEAQEEWFHRLSQILRQESRENVDLRYEWEEAKMADFREHADDSLDLVVVDGGPRELCVRNAWGKVRPGGYLYLDNSDSPFLCGRAVELLLDWVGRDPRCFRFFTDFVPGYFFASQGLLVRRKVDSSR
jgi:hypothetical protein